MCLCCRALAVLLKSKEDKEDIKVHVDQGSALKLISFAALPSECRPRGDAVDWLASECAKLRKREVLRPFPYADLRKWVPAYAAELDTKVGGCEDKVMLMSHWQLAFDKFALGAAMVQSNGVPIHFLLPSAAVRNHIFLCRKASSVLHVSQGPFRGLHESWLACSSQKRPTRKS